MISAAAAPVWLIYLCLAVTDNLRKARATNHYVLRGDRGGELEQIA